MTEYDTLAWFYDRYWGPRFHDAARPALERLLYSTLRAADTVLELCCGTGYLTQELVARGYRVIGIDSGAEMLRYARRRAPSARLVCGDIARPPVAIANCAAAVSTFDSINHLLTAHDIDAAFRFAASALRPGGMFVFDVNTEETYRSEWGKSSALAEHDAALFIRGTYDVDARIGRTLITMFRQDGDGRGTEPAGTPRWIRADVEMAQRCYDGEELAHALRAAGFVDVSVLPAHTAGMAGDIATGRAFVTGRKR